MSTTSRLTILTALLLLCINPIVRGVSDSAGQKPAVLPQAAEEAQIDQDSAGVVAPKAAVTATEDNGSDIYPMSPERKAKLVSYSRFNNFWRFVRFFVTIGLLALILFTGLSARLRSLAQRVKLRFFAVWLFWALFSIVDYLLYLPFAIYRGFVVESDYGFMNQTFTQWWGEDLLNLLIMIVIGVVPVWFFYWLVNRMRRWWLAFSLGAIPFLILMIVIVPVWIAPLFNKFEPLKDQQLKAQILTLAEKAGIDGARVFEVNGSKQSTKVNAYVTGLFGSKRIVLYDTLINNFTTAEILFVMGHEMGHYLMHHIWWGLGVAILFMLFALWLIDKTIHPVIRRFKRRFRFDRLGDIASLPLVLVFVTVITFVFQPITNSVSRYMEHQSDKFGMDITGVDGETAARTFDKLAVFNLSDPDPNPVIEFWFYSHPSLKKRMAFARSYRP